MTTIICAVCKRVLDSVITEDGGSYQHTPFDREHGDGHEAVPVSSTGDERIRCDFCHRDVTHPWVLPSRSFNWLGDETGDNWTADDACARLIQDGNWDGLLVRSIAGFKRATGEEMHPAARVMVQAMHAQLRRNITGALIPPAGTP